MNFTRASRFRKVVDAKHIAITTRDDNGLPVWRIVRFEVAFLVVNIQGETINRIYRQLLQPGCRQLGRCTGLREAGRDAGYGAFERRGAVAVARLRC